MKSMYEEIKRICVEVGTVKDLSVIKRKTVYQNKTNPEDTFNYLEEAFAKGLDLAKYEKIVVEKKIKLEIVKTIFGNADFKMTPDIKKDFILFNEIMMEVTKPTRNTPKKTADPVKDSAESVKDSEKVNKKAEKPAKENNHATAIPAS